MSIKLVYKVTPDKRISEIEWLRTQMIFPAVAEYYDYSVGTLWIRFGVIVSPAQALTVKLRHPLEFQTDYRQR